MYKHLWIILSLLFPYQLFAQTGKNIGQRTFDFKDATRNRPLITEVWYPTDDTLRQTDHIFSPFARQLTVRNGKLPSSKLPLIMLSHGTGGGRLTMEWLAQALVNNGFIVAAVDHWGNTYDNKIPLEFLKPWERPLDISFVLTELLKDQDLSTIIDTEKIGAIGFSFGGFTVIALAGGEVDYATLIHYFKTVGHKELELPEFPGLPKYLDDPALTEGAKHAPPLKDTRIKAFFAISPALGPGFTSSRQVANITAPLYITGSRSDSIAPIRNNALLFHQLIGGSGYYEFPGKTGHYVMLGEAIDDVKKTLPTYFSDDASVNRHEVHLQVDNLAIGFFQSRLRAN